MDHSKCERIPGKHLLLLHWLHYSLWLCGSQQSVENSLRDENTRLPYLTPEKPIYTSRRNRTGHGTMDWFQTGKRDIKAVYYHPVYLIYMKSTSCEMPGWVKHKLETRLLEKYQLSQICRWHHLHGRRWRGPKEPLDEGERAEWKSGLKTTFKKLRSWHQVPSLQW